LNTVIGNLINNSNKFKMNDPNNERRLLASLALFRELYDSKKDVYMVIAEFLKEIIISNAKRQFNITEITQLLNSSFFFNLPEAVVEASLRRIDYIGRSGGYYQVTNFGGLEKTNINEKQTEIRESNNLLLNDLIDYIEEQTKAKLSKNEKQKAVNSFCSFLLDDFEIQEYSKFISAFIIHNGNDKKFSEQLSLIKEGVILYSGIKYDSNLFEVGQWKSRLTIFIDTELLFYFAGYDGELYKTLFTDFLAFVKEINDNSGQSLISLRYFKDNYDEILRFFAKAEQIVAGTDRLTLAHPAMVSIVNGCKSPSDVVTRKSIFFRLLKNNDILEDEYQSYFSDENHKYNISDLGTIKKIGFFLGKDILENLRILNFVSIRRGESAKNKWENIGYILVSGNSLTRKVAWHSEIKNNGCVPLVTDLSFLTNKFWYKLNKGFGPSNYPKSFNVITKAQIILSSLLKDNVSKQYDLLQVKFKKGELTEDQVIATIVNLRKEPINPENIIEENLPTVLSSISEDKIEKYMNEYDYIKNVAAKKTEENEELLEHLDSKNRELEAKEFEAKKYKKGEELKEIEIIRNNITAKGKLLDEKKNIRAVLSKQRIPIEKIAITRYIIFKWSAGISLIILYAIVCFLIKKMGWNILEAWTYILGILVSNILPFLYLLIFEKEINPYLYVKNKKHQIINQTYFAFNFDIDKLTSLDSEIEALIVEISELKLSIG
jgi:hypothetical protein